jgi:hypothetical protein
LKRSSCRFVARVISVLFCRELIRKQDLGQRADLVRLVHRHAHLDAHKAALAKLGALGALAFSISRATSV